MILRPLDEKSLPSAGNAPAGRRRMHEDDPKGGAYQSGP
jgi:hypothetical protein